MLTYATVCCRALRTSQVLIEQGLPGQLGELLESHVDRFLRAAEVRRGGLKGEASPLAKQPTGADKARSASVVEHTARAVQAVQAVQAEKKTRSHSDGDARMTSSVQSLSALSPSHPHAHAHSSPGAFDRSLSDIFYESWTPQGIARVDMLNETDARVEQRLQTQIAIIEVLGCVGTNSQAQLRRFTDGLVMPSLLLYLLAFRSPPCLREAAAQALSSFLTSPHAAVAHTLVASGTQIYLLY
jgi:hypothetical protein